MRNPELGIGIVCGGFVGFFLLLFSFLALMRWFRHRETLAMIEKGMVPADAAKKRNGKSTLVWGIGIAAFGLAALGALLLLGWFLWSARTTGGIRSVTYIGVVLIPGLIVLLIGIALIVIYLVTRPAPADASAHRALEEATLPEEPDQTADLPVAGFEAKVPPVERDEA